MMSLKIARYMEYILLNPMVGVSCTVQWFYYHHVRLMIERYLSNAIKKPFPFPKSMVW